MDINFFLGDQSIWKRCSLICICQLLVTTCCLDHFGSTGWASWLMVCMVNHVYWTLIYQVCALLILTITFLKGTNIFCASFSQGPSDDLHHNYPS